MKKSKVALSMSTFVVKKKPKIHTAFVKKRKREGVENRKMDNKGGVRELNNTAKTKSNLNKKGIRKCHHPKHGSVS